jgi:hypothetical protein
MDEREESSSSSDCSFGLEASLIPVLNSNPEIEEWLYYGEDADNGFVVVSPYEIEVRYESLGSSGLPISTDVYVDEQVVATINFQPNYIGSLLAIVYEGEVRCGVVTEEDIRL